MRLIVLAAALFLCGASASADVVPPPVSPAAEYYVGENGAPVGPLSLEQVEARIAAGATTGADLVWKSGLTLGRRSNLHRRVAAVHSLRVQQTKGRIGVMVPERKALALLRAGTPAA